MLILEFIRPISGVKRFLIQINGQTFANPTGRIFNQFELRQAIVWYLATSPSIEEAFLSVEALCAQ